MRERENALVPCTTQPLQHSLVRSVRFGWGPADPSLEGLIICCTGEKSFHVLCMINPGFEPPPNIFWHKRECFSALYHSATASRCIKAWRIWSGSGWPLSGGPEYLLRWRQELWYPLHRLNSLNDDKSCPRFKPPPNIFWHERERMLWCLIPLGHCSTDYQGM